MTRWNGGHAMFFGRVVVIALVAAALGSCSPYTLRGKVIPGDISYVAMVDREDPRLEESGLEGAQVVLETDPDRLNRETVGEAVTDAEGNFAISVDQVGAGFLLYDMGLRVTRPGYQRATQMFKLPSSEQRALVILKPGQDAGGDRPEDPYEQYKKFR